MTAGKFMQLCELALNIDKGYLHFHSSASIRTKMGQDVLF